MKCQRCESKRILNVSAKTSDRLSLWIVDGDKDHTGYNDLGIDCLQDEDGWSDYLVVLICLDCGQAQGNFPQAKIEDLE